ncbi:family 43 glycosylhydrolase [Micromonospora sp. DT4]|uniref:family 43 glycosylhydrolase n=1 Tax=Micromonospora sp. DT4 TaxID=3393438 RepID=UPI003CF7325E
MPLPPDRTVAATRRAAGSGRTGPDVRRRSVLAALLVVLAVSAGLPVAGPAQAAPAANYTNPLVNPRADPHIFRHTNGYYYMTATVPQYDRIGLRRATTLQGLSSASATDANYCLGMLSASATANLLDAASWSKSPNPVFATSAATGQYGPGHNSFTVSEDGQSDILVYHDHNYRDISGDPLNDPNRRTRLQKVYWNADGTPNFGIPVPDGATPVRLRSHDLTTSYIRHYDYRARVEANVTNLADSQFRIVNGLAGGGSVSLESTNFPGYYLRHYGFTLSIAPNDGSSIFAAPPTPSAGSPRPADADWSTR